MAVSRERGGLGWESPSGLSSSIRPNWLHCKTSSMGDQEMQVYVLEAEVSPRVFNSRINTKIQICFNLVVTRSILNCWAGSLSQILLKFQKSFLSPPVRNSS